MHYDAVSCLVLARPAALPTVALGTHRTINCPAIGPPLGSLCGPTGLSDTADLFGYKSNGISVANCGRSVRLGLGGQCQPSLRYLTGGGSRMLIVRGRVAARCAYPHDAWPVKGLP